MILKISCLVLIISFVRACFSYEVVEDVSFEQSDIDDLPIKIKLWNNKFVKVDSVFRNPSSAFATVIEKLLCVLNLKSERKLYRFNWW